MKRIRLTIADVIPVPYRLPLYARLASDPAYELRVDFLGHGHVDRSWSDLELPFPHRFLAGPAVTTRRGNVLTYHVNPGIARTVLAPRPDALLLSGWAQPSYVAAAAIAKAARVPYLIASESHGRRSRSSAARVLRATVFSPVVRGAAATFGTGSLARRYLAELGARPDGIFTLPNACDVHALSAEAAEMRRNGAGARLRSRVGTAEVVGYVGRLVAVKGVDLLFEAIRVLRLRGRDVGALIAGDGPERSALEGNAAELPVIFLGSVPAEEVTSVYTAVDTLCVPSRDEPWGVVVNEAMSASTPVVASDAVGAAADLVIPGETGARFPTGDADALADALARVLDDAVALGAGAYARVAHWGYDLAESELRLALAKVLG